MKRAPTAAYSKVRVRHKVATRSGGTARFAVNLKNPEGLIKHAMSDIPSIRLSQLHGRLGNLVYEMTRIHFQQFGPARTWSPAMNIYRCQGGISICADLAGVDTSDVELRVESRRLLIRGKRRAPEPAKSAGKVLQVLAMEIDQGQFESEVLLPADVDSGRVAVEQKNGLLWIYLPLHAEA